jgi:choline dehydrogenase-like flavoprotein
VLASGIQVVTKDGERCRISEMILAAGTIQSPHLLELSGIGSAELLQSHSIDVVINNKFVGQNLQDHAFCALQLEDRGWPAIWGYGAAICLEAYRKYKAGP